MRFLHTTLVVALGLATLVPGRAFAGGFEVPDQSAVAGATGGAGTARRGDPSSAWYQPAETADGRGFRGALGLALAIPTITAEGLEDPMETASTVTAVSPPPHLHLSYSENEWSVGAYIGLSHGSSVNWPDGWWGRFESMQTGIIGIRAAPFFALRLGGERGLIEGFPDIRISIGAHVDTVRVEQARMLDFIDQEGRVQLLFWGAGVGGDASVYYQATPELAFGVTYKSRTWMRMNGDADFTVPDAFVGRAPDQHATTELTIPDRLVLGFGYQEGMFGVWADFGVTFWSVRQRTQVDFERDVTSDIDTPSNWHDAIALRLGGEVSPIPEIHARAGLFFDQEVGPDDTLAASSPDMARLGVTLGAGFDITRELGVDLYYSYVAFLGRDSTSLDAALAHYSGELHLVGLTVRLVVDSGPPQADAVAEPEPEVVDPLDEPPDPQVEGSDESVGTDDGDDEEEPAY
ncbi:MAG: outer membrane protein transport protein [Sandaracinaceae bacterium]|nr:outer membrane protein transport protein [Sandaracinaceae bacterium]